MRAWCDTLNPNTHPVAYQSDNHFQAFDVYSQLGDALGLASYHRYALLWRALKKEIRDRYQEKKMLTVWVLDEGQQLNPAFLSSLPAFLNMDFDPREYLSIVFIATPDFYRTLQRASYAALYSRLHGCCQCNPLSLDAFMSLSSNALEASGAAQGLFSDNTLQLLHCACQGRLREAHQLMSQALHIAAHEGLTHVTEGVVEKAIEQLNTIK